MNQSRSPVFERLDQVVGKEVKADLTVGKPLTADDVRGPVVVFRGNQVSVWVSHRTAQIQMIMTASEDGGVGDWIEVNHPLDKKKFSRKVRVIGEHTAELTPDAPLSQNLAASRHRADARKGTKP